MKTYLLLILCVFCCTQVSSFNKTYPKHFHTISNFNRAKNYNSPAAGTAAVIPSPNLGSLAAFALFTTTGAVGNTGVSFISGNIGANIGAISGFAGSVVNGSFENANAATAQAVTDLTSLYNQLSAIPVTAVHAPILGNGETLYSGVYSIGAAGSAAGVLTLDGQGDPNAMFIIKINGAFTTGAGTTIVLVNGASAANVFWVAEGAIAMAAATTMAGTLIANNAAVSMGAAGILQGRMFSTTGAVAIYADNITIPVSGFTWIGTISTNWNTAANWLNDSVPSATDPAFIGVGQSFNYFPNIPVSSGLVSVGSVTFGSQGGQAAGIVINTGSTLNVVGAITYQSDAGSVLGYTCAVSGMGTLTANSLNIIADSTTSPSFNQIFASSVANFNINTNIALTSTNHGAALFNAMFNLTGGTASLNGIFQTTNTATGISSITILPATLATLKILNISALSGLSATGTNIVTFANTGATVEYSGASQNIFTDSNITGLTGGVTYQHIKFSGTGIKTVSTGSLNVAGDYTCVLANDAANYVDLTSPIILFGGTTQNLAGGAGSGTLIHHATFSGNGIKTIISGNFSIVSSGVITMAGTNPGTILAAGGLLTLNSDSTGSATVAPIATSGPTITGNVNVQRYIAGGAGYRGYRLLSSPVYGALANSNHVYSINYIANSSYTSGTTGIAGGFDKSGNPTFYLYRENMAPSNSTFISGNFRGINQMGWAPNFDYLIDGDAGTFNIPAANGYLFFFRGDRNVNNLAAETTAAYIPTGTMLTTTGTLNIGQINVVNWYTPGSSNLGWTNTTANSSVRGYNLVGNPYASSIDWEQYNSLTPTSGIYANNIKNTVYELNPVTHNYDTYQVGGASTNNGSNIIVSGQGFFVLALNNSNPQLIFNESAKTMSQNTGLKLFMSTKANLAAITIPVSYIRLQIAKDSINVDDTYIGFNTSARTEFTEDEDAAYKQGTGQVALSSYSSDHISLAINKQPLNKPYLLIPLNISAATTGVYKLNISKMVAIPEIFDIWLIDAYKKDSLDMRHNKTYAFNLTMTDTNSYGANRFSLTLRQNPQLNIHLLSFKALRIKAGVQIIWISENEENYTSFTIERSTDQGKIFTAIGEMPSNGLGTYSFPDKYPLAGTDAYRLKIEDLNGAITYSNIVTLLYQNTADNLLKNSVDIFPNPATSLINIAIAQNTIAAKGTIISYHITVMNNIGLIVKNTDIADLISQQNISTLLPGAYTLKVTNNTDKTIMGVKKFVKL